VDKTEWHNVVAYGRTAEIVRDYVKKGKELFIEGRLQTRSWDDKETGAKKSRTEIIVNEMTLLGGSGGGGARSEGGERSSGSYSSSRSSSSSSASAPSSQPDYADQGITDEDIPF
jgi:single-strand DNA-binding protein